MIGRTLIAAAVLALTTSDVAAQDSQSRDERIGKIKNPAVRAQVRLFADSAQSAGLPDESIINIGLKSNQYANVAADVVIRTAREQLFYMRTARATLGADVSSQVIGAAVDVLKAGIEPTTMKRVAERRHNVSAVAALSVLTDLVQTNVPVDVAESAVTRLAVAGADDAYLTNFRDAVASDIRLTGQIPTAAVTTRVNSAITTDATGGTTLVNGPATRAGGRIRIPPEN